LVSVVKRVRIAVAIYRAVHSPPAIWENANQGLREKYMKLADAAIAAAKAIRPPVTEL